MSTRYKTWPGQLYYTTTTVVGWIDIFTRQQYVDILYDSIRYCQEHKQLELYAYVIMPNHFHLICRTQEDALNYVMRDLKSFTAREIVKAVETNLHESRREWLMHMFRYYGRGSANNRDHQFWQHGNHPFELRNETVLWQKMRYLHNNPVKAGIVTEPHHYLHSSAHPDRRLQPLDLV